MPRPKKTKAITAKSTVELAAVNVPHLRMDKTGTDLLDMIASRPYNAATDPYVEHAQALDAPMPNALALLEDTDPGHHHDDGPWKQGPPQIGAGGGMQIVSNSKHSREQNFRKGTELIVAGVGMLRSTFSEANDAAKPPTMQSSLFARTEQDLRMARLRVESLEEALDKANDEVERYREMAVLYKSKFLDAVQRLMKWEPDTKL